jgi:hypothetical protein
MRVRARLAADPSAAASSVLSTVTHNGGWPRAAERAAVVRSRSVLPMPSSAVIEAATPARRARASSPPETVLAPKPCSAISRTSGGSPLALSE